MQSVNTAQRPLMPAAAGQMKLISALVDHEDADDLRAVLAEAGVVSIVLSDASLYTVPTRTEVTRGQRRTVDSLRGYGAV